MRLKLLKHLKLHKKISTLVNNLHQKDDQHQHILDNAIDGFWLLDKNMRLIETNTSYCQMSGYSKIELKNINIKKLQSLSTTDDIPKHLKLKQSRFESQHRRKDGSIFDVEVSIQFLPNNQQIAAFFQDISLRKQIELDLKNSEAFKLCILNSVSAQIAVLDHNGFIILTNQAWKDFAIQNSPEADSKLTKTDIGTNYLECCQSHLNNDTSITALNAYSGIKAVLNGELPEFSMEYACHSPTELRWFKMNVTPLTPLKNGVVVSHTAITEHKLIEAKLQLAASVFTHALEGILITDCDGSILQVNDAFSEITGFTREEVLKKNPRILSSGRQEKEFYTDMWHDLMNKGHWYGEIWNRHKNGEIYAALENISTVYDNEGNPTHYVALISDITRTKLHEHELEHKAHYDALTNLPNRVLLEDRLHQAIALAKRQNLILSVVFLDLDGFKAINDTYGHLAGDQLLIAVAKNMSDCLREVDTFARIGGDEFIALLIDVGNMESHVFLFNRLLSAASQPEVFNGINLNVTASMGVTFYPQTVDIDPDMLIRQADQAMYQAKLAGRNGYHIFDIELDKQKRSQHESLLNYTTSTSSD